MATALSGQQSRGGFRRTPRAPSGRSRWQWASSTPIAPFGTSMINGVATIPRLPPAIPMPRRHASQEDYTEELQYQQCALEIKISTLGENDIFCQGLLPQGGVPPGPGMLRGRATHRKSSLRRGPPRPTIAQCTAPSPKCIATRRVLPQEGAPEPAQGPYGSDHPFLVDSYDQMAMAHHSKGDHDRALARYEKALAIKSKSGAEDPPMVGIYNATAWPRCVSRRLLSAVAKGRRSRGSGGGRIRDDAINHKPSAATDGSVTMKRETICAVP